MFQATGAALIRAASYPDDLSLPAWPDLTSDEPENWLGWLQQACMGAARVCRRCHTSRTDAGRPNCPNWRIGADQFDGDLAVQHAVIAAPHLAHTAGFECLDQFVSAGDRLRAYAAPILSV